jgi:predicted nucleotide-binding protein (sugar kinase/HSP70/actin superfamily)
MHEHVEELFEKGIDTIFYPCMPYNFDEKTGDNHYNCPVVAYYPELLKANVLKLSEIRFLNPYLMPSNTRTFPKMMADFMNETFSVPQQETKMAVKKAYAAYAAYQQSLLAFGREALLFAKEHKKEVIVLSGRPYHIDPEINHGISELLTSLGLVVISEDCLERPPER